MSKPIKDFSIDELQALVDKAGLSSFRALQILTWIYGRGVHSYDEMTDLPQVIRRIQTAKGRGDEVVALLSFLAYSDTPEPGMYWGEMAIICFNPSDADVMNGYIARIGELMADGKRPDVNLNTKAAQVIFEEDEWVPSKRVPLPDRKKKGFALLKDHRSASERAIEQGRAGNKGCYVVSYLFIALVIAALVLGACKLLGVL